MNRQKSSEWRDDDDEEDLKILKEAAVTGNTGFWKQSSNKPQSYYLTIFNYEKDRTYHGNIFHLALVDSGEDFIREAIKNLPPNTSQQLLLQQRKSDMYNPLHLAATIGKVEKVKLLLDIFNNACWKSTKSDAKPWLQKDVYGNTPCHLALAHAHENCGLMILEMDLDTICNITNNLGVSVLYRAVYKNLNKVALHILTSANSFSCSGRGFNTLHIVPNCSQGEEICKVLLNKVPDLVTQISEDGYSILHTWAYEGKLWPFRCLLESCNNVSMKVLVDLMSSTEHAEGYNPIHSLVLNINNQSNEKEVVDIANLLIETYKRETTAQRDSLFPWLAHSKNGSTPLSLAICNGYESFANNLLSKDNDALRMFPGNAVHFAVEEGRDAVALGMLEIIQNKGWTQLLVNQEKDVNALHFAPKCKEFCKALMRQYPEFLKERGRSGETVLHNWVAQGEVWAFEYILQSNEIDLEWRKYFISLISVIDPKNRNTPFHVAANSKHEAKIKIVELLAKAYKEENPNSSSTVTLPWFRKNDDDEGPLHIAIRYQYEDLALCILSLENDTNTKINELLDYYKPEHKTLFLALENKCLRVANYIFDKFSLKKKYVRDFSSRRNVLHIAPTYAALEKELATMLCEKAPKLITEKDNNGKTALDEASETGVDWMIQLMMEKVPSALDSVPLAWIPACKKGHLSTIRAFIGYNPERFKEHCITLKDSPLHHIRLSNLTEYNKFFEIPAMKELINLQNYQGETPLHTAIRNDDIHLAESLLKMEGIIYNIKDHKRESAIELLEAYCDQHKWDELCRKVKIDPKIRTTYFQHKTNMLDVRNTLSVVAALLATITFTAGFTLPGGFNQNTGEAVLDQKAAFLVFLISDALAMCCSMLVLICLIWSMVYDSMSESSKSLVLIDRSMMLLMLALYSTLLAFMTGVYVVTSPSSLWASILIIVMCSLIVFGASKSLLYKLLSKLIPFAESKQGDQFRLLEEGKAFSCLGGGCRNCLKCN